MLRLVVERGNDGSICILIMIIITKFITLKIRRQLTQIVIARRKSKCLILSALSVTGTDITLSIQALIATHTSYSYRQGVTSHLLSFDRTAARRKHKISWT